MHCFVTGATAGIGAAVARMAVAEGHSVTGCGRRADRLEALATELGPAFLPVVADVTDRASLDAAAAAGLERHGVIHAVIANAGRGQDGELLDTSPEELQGVMAVNLAGVHATVLATRSAWSPRARVVIVSSVCAALSIPRMGAYCATKHALDAYATALRMELAEGGHRVTTVNPGTVATEFFDVAPAAGTSWTWRPGGALSPQQVAAAILRQARGRGPRRCYLPWTSRALTALVHLAPGLVERILRGRLQAMRREQAGN